MERSNTTPNQKFGPGWFWPALERYRGVLIQVLAASFVVQLFTRQPFADPGDHRQGDKSAQPRHPSGSGHRACGGNDIGRSTQQPQDFLFAETTNRIDQRLGAEVIDHLLRLPRLFRPSPCRRTRHPGRRIGEDP